MSNKFYVLIKIIENGKVVEDGVVVNLPSKRRKWFKSVTNAQRFINKLDASLNDGLYGKYKIVTQNELEEYLNE